MLLSARWAAPAAVLACAAAAAGCESGAPPTGASLPDEAVVVCDAQGPSLATPRVRLRGDGIHLRLENEAGRPLAYSIRSEPGFGQGSSLPESGLTEVVPQPPGPFEIRCTDPASGDDPGTATPATLRVVDPLAVWKPAVAVPSCTETVTEDVRSGERSGQRDPPVAVARRYLVQRSVLEPGDVVAAAGYPDRAAAVRLARHGRTVAVLSFDDHASLARVDACRGIGFG